MPGDPRLDTRLIGTGCQQRGTANVNPEEVSNVSCLGMISPGNRATGKFEAPLDNTTVCALPPLFFFPSSARIPF